MRSVTPLFALVLAAALAGCSALLPKTTETTDGKGAGWQSYEEAQAAFDRIVPGTTTLAELRALGLDPKVNPNITQLQNYEVRQMFMVNKSVTLGDLDRGVRECVSAKLDCVGWQVSQTSTQKRRTGNAALDLLRMHRVTNTEGWRFTGLILIKHGVVVYKLTSGQPHIQEIAVSDDTLGPLQVVGSKLNGINGIEVTDVRNGIKSGDSTSGHVSAVTTGVRR